MFLSSILGTFLDLYFVEKRLYEFPMRFLPKVFSINIVFTLVILPVFVVFYLYIMDQLNRWGKAGLILLLSLLMPIFEKLSEVLGFFAHSDDWKHIYTFFGYLVFLRMIYAFHQWLENRKK